MKEFESIFLSIIIFAGAVAPLSSLSGEEVDTAEIKSFAVKFLESVRTKDCKTFLQFLSPEVPIFAIFPNGKTAQGYQAFIESQNAWFQGATGSFDYEIKKVEPMGQQRAFFAIEATYKNLDENGQAFEMLIYISFIFQKQGSSWYLTHDQNTLISKKQKLTSDGPLLTY